MTTHRLNAVRLVRLITDGYPGGPGHPQRVSGGAGDGAGGRGGLRMGVGAGQTENGTRNLIDWREDLDRSLTPKWVYPM